MDLNRTQLLVHDDAELNKFRIDHGNPNDIQIERSDPNKDANLVEGNGNRISICIWLIHQIRIRFVINLILKEVMAHCHLTYMQVLVNFV